MAKVFLNRSFNFHEKSDDNVLWSASNGATRRTLKLINSLKINEGGSYIPSKGNIGHLFAQIGKLDKGNHSFIFINQPLKKDNGRVLGIVVNRDYGFAVLKGLEDKEVYSNYSSGGVGNSCSQFGIYKVGVIIEIFTYKNRTKSSYIKLTKNGWIDVSWEKINKVEEGQEYV